jgi:hypothetical protein
VTGRDRTCDAPRFRRALYRTELRSREWAEPESNRRPPPYQRGALPPELSACAVQRNSGRGWARTSSLLFVRQALSRLSYSPIGQIRDKGSNLDLHVQSVASCRLDDPGACVFCGRSRQNRASPSISTGGDRRSRRDPLGEHRVLMSRPARSRTMLSMPLACPSTLDQRLPATHDRSSCRPTWRGFGARASNVVFEKLQAKADA